MTKKGTHEEYLQLTRSSYLEDSSFLTPSHSGGRGPFATCPFPHARLFILISHNFKRGTQNLSPLLSFLVVCLAHSSQVSRRRVERQCPLQPAAAVTAVPAGRLPSVPRFLLPPPSPSSLPRPTLLFLPLLPVIPVNLSPSPSPSP